MGRKRLTEKEKELKEKIRKLNLETDYWFRRMLYSVTKMRNLVRKSRRLANLLKKEMESD